MITGAHFLLYSTNPEGDREFFRDVLNFRAVDAGGGWLIFALPPAEIAVHPGSGNFAQLHGDHQLAGAVLYLMCDDLRMVMQSLEQRKISCTPVSEAQWGITTTLRLPQRQRDWFIPAQTSDGDLARFGRHGPFCQWTRTIGLVGTPARHGRSSIMCQTS